MDKKLRTKAIDHAHIYFEDGHTPSAMGYGTTGLIPNEINYPRKNATKVRDGLDDNLVREIIADRNFIADWDQSINIKPEENVAVYKHTNYKLLQHNCQHFVEAVDSKYKEKEKEKWNSVETRKRSNNVFDKS